MSNSSVRVRFAPSPTGFLHVGGARTALFNWLYARKNNGSLVLRIEDTDAARNSSEAIEVIYRGLDWLGIDWDEGGHAGGPYGPYFQSQRGDIYQRYLDQLLADGRAYEDAGSIRFKVSRDTIVVPDAVRGDVSFDLTDESIHPDFTLRRPDGSWIFHFASVVDDLEMQISHVIRGEDHLSNTPRHIDLYRALGSEPPVFAHIPLLLNEDGSKMSKRDQGASVASYIEQGFEPAAVANYLCLLGWSPKDDREKLSLDEVIQLFEFSGITSGNASFSMEKLLWLQGEYAREISGEKLVELATTSWRNAGLPVDNYPDDYVAEAAATCEGKFKLPQELVEYAGFYFRESVEISPDDAAAGFDEQGIATVRGLEQVLANSDDFSAAGVEAVMRSYAADNGLKLKHIVLPVRLACTGTRSGPSLFHLLAVLGRERVLERLSAASQ